MGIHDRVENDIECFRPTFERLEGGRDLLSASDFQWNDIDAEFVGSCPSLIHLQHSIGTAHIGHNGQPSETGDKLTKKFDSLAGDIGRLKRHAGGISTRERKTCNKTCANRIPRTREDYRDDRRGLLDRKGRGSRISNDYIHLELDEIARDFSKSL